MDYRPDRGWKLTAREQREREIAEILRGIPESAYAGAPPVGVVGDVAPGTPLVVPLEWSATRV